MKFSKPIPFQVFCTNTPHQKLKKSDIQNNYHNRLKQNSVKLQKNFFDRIDHINSSESYYDQVDVWEDLNQLSKMIYVLNLKISKLKK
jgi:hypothetical protein